MKAEINVRPKTRLYLTKMLFLWLMKHKEIMAYGEMDIRFTHRPTYPPGGKPLLPFNVMLDDPEIWTQR
jgi:hypothetical protein